MTYRSTRHGKGHARRPATQEGRRGWEEYWARKIRNYSRMKWNFKDHAILTQSCSEALDEARQMVLWCGEPYVVLRSLEDEDVFAVIPHVEKIPAGWNTVALYDTDGNEYGS